MSMKNGIYSLEGESLVEMIASTPHGNGTFPNFEPFDWCRRVSYVTLVRSAPAAGRDPHVTVVLPARVHFRVFLTEDGTTYTSCQQECNCKIHLSHMPLHLWPVDMPLEIIVLIPISKNYCPAVRELMDHEYEVPTFSSFCESTWIYHLLHIFHSKNQDLERSFRAKTLSNMTYPRYVLFVTPRTLFPYHPPDWRKRPGTAGNNPQIFPRHCRKR